MPRDGAATGSAEGDVVEGVHHQAQIGHHVLDLTPLVEADPAHDQVRDARATERVLQHARLGIGAVEDGHVAVVPALVVQAADRAGHEGGFLVLVPGPVHLGPLPLGVLRPQALVLPLGVVLDHRRRHAEDLLGGAVVLLERHHPASGKSFSKSRILRRSAPRQRYTTGPDRPPRRGSGAPG
jgi:hypothetical protein